ncbi:hypothetical protein BCR59_22865 [Klebsiella pneumoniae]|nr:hypothetical protein BCR59_22865 [Klebsiella pneumoniae]
MADILLLDTCIVIRSAYVQEGIATVQAGAGIVLDSVPQSEADETRNKARACCAPLPRPITRRRFSDG